MHLLVMCLEHAVHNYYANAVFREWRAYLFSPAVAPDQNSSQVAMGVPQNYHSIEPADLQLRFPKTYLECIFIPNSRWLNILDKDHTKTADELEEMISDDKKLFIEVSHLFLLTLPRCVLKRGQVFCKNTPQGSQENSAKEDGL